MNNIVTSFKQNGFVHIPAIIPNKDLNIVRQIGLGLKEKVVNQKLLDTPKSFGAPTYSRTLDMSGKLDERLYDISKSVWLTDIAKQLLGQDNIYLFNDQIVVKLPNEDFLFPAHTDNWFGPDPEAAKRGAFKTITCCWVLDDFTDTNGSISIQNISTDEWITVLAKAGDLVIWDGNTPHQSGINMSCDPRCVWLQIYATHDISLMKNINENDFVSNVDFTRFYSIKL